MFEMETPNILNGGRAKIGLVAAACLLTTFGLGSTTVGQRIISQIGITDTFAQTTDAAGRVLEKGSTAVQAFLGRSPGERGATDMLKGKVKRDIARNDDAPGKSKPTQRALGKIFSDPLQSLAGPIAPAPVVEFLPLDAGVIAASIPALALAAPVGSGIFSPFAGGGPSGGGFIGGGGNGGGSGGGSGFIPPASPPTAAAVPEPSTWILLLIGFAAVGASIRRTRASQISSLNNAKNFASVQ